MNDLRDRFAMAATYRCSEMCDRYPNRAAVGGYILGGVFRCKRKATTKIGEEWLCTAHANRRDKAKGNV